MNVIFISLLHMSIFPVIYMYFVNVYILSYSLYIFKY